MTQVCIPIPMPAEGEPLELTVAVGDEAPRLRYRVETLHWDGEGPPSERADRIRAFIQQYDSAWSLVEIGAPRRGVVSITFRKWRDRGGRAQHST